MGRHAQRLGRQTRSERSQVQGVPAAAAAKSSGSTFSPARLTVQALAIVACAGFVMVTVTDPYAGATASPYYQNVGQTTTATVESHQSFIAEGEYELALAEVDGIEVVVPEPEPVPVPVVATEEGSAGSASVSAAVAPPASPGSAQAYAQEQLSARGLGGEQYDCLVSLWNRESGWNMYAENRSSGAYGIPQALPGSKMASAGADWATNYRTQVDWGLGYIFGRYGSPCGAWSSSESRGWY